MTHLSKIVLAAVLSGALPAAASARDCDHDHDRRAELVQPSPWQPGPGPGPRGWREGSHRERELAAVRAELRALDAQRADFHARFAGRPGKLRHYDRSYLEQRAALEQRWHALQRLAWR